MENLSGAAPKVSLNRWQRWRLVIVGCFVAFAVARVVPDVVRLAMPLGLFDYVTDNDGVVFDAPAMRPKGTDELRAGDRVRIDRIKPADRKPGLVRVGYTREDFDRRLPIERARRERIVHLKATPETPAGRAVAVIGIFVFITSVAFGALLVIAKPSVATIGFFLFCLGGDYPTTYSDVFFDNPWRQIPQWLGDTLRGFAPVGLCVFALCLAFDDPRVQRRLAAVFAVVALILGSLDAYAAWRISYAGLPAQSLAGATGMVFTAVAVVTGIGFVAAFVRARGAERQRTGWIVAAFTVAALARVLSERFFPHAVNYWQNGLLLAAGVIPVVVVWVAVVKHHFFNVDFVLSRGVVYAAIGAALVGVLGASEEILGYIFYNNTDLAQIVAFAVVFVFGAGMSKFNAVLHPLVDRFVFPGRRAQRKQLERIATNILGATTSDAVYASLLQDVPSVLDLSFGGIMARTSDGGFELSRGYEWPEDCVDRLPPGHPLVREVDKSRGVAALDDARSTMIKSAFPNERLTFAAPLHYDRSVSALVFYGHSVSGVDIDPDERTLLINVIAHASIALGAIELARYRAAALGLEPSPAQ